MIRLFTLQLRQWDLEELAAVEWEAIMEKMDLRHLVIGKAL